MTQTCGDTLHQHNALAVYDVYDDTLTQFNTDNNLCTVLEKFKRGKTKDDRTPTKYDNLLNASQMTRRLPVWSQFWVDIVMTLTLHLARYRRAASRFYNDLKSKVGLAATKTTALRVNLNIKVCIIVAPRLVRHGLRALDSPTLSSLTVCPCHTIPYSLVLQF